MGVSSTEAKSDTKTVKRAVWFGPAVLVFLGAFAAYYYFHVSRQTEYFASRNLRMLDIVARQLTDRLQTPDDLGELAATPAREYIKPDANKRRIGIDSEALAAAHLTIADVVKHAAALSLRWDESARAFTLDSAEAPGAFDAAVAYMRRPIVSGNRSLMWDSASSAFKPGALGFQTDGWPAKKVFGQVFDQSFVGIFDDVIVADQTGQVIWQKDKRTCSLHRLGQLTEAKEFGKATAIPFAALQERAMHRRVLVEDREYRLFSRPFAVPVAGQAKPQSWVVAGLVTRSRFVAQSVAISYTLLIAVLAALLMVIFALPFLKIGLVGELQRVRVTDIVLLFVSHICATAIMTIVIIDTLTYLRARGLADVQLRELAADIESQARTEMTRAYIVLLKLENVIGPNAPAKGRVLDVLPQTGDFPVYPFFESFARVDVRGMQRQKWFLEKRETDPISVVDRAYFKEALADHGWVGDVNQGKYVVDSIRSGTTGVVQAVMAKPAIRALANDDNAVVTLAMPMMSLIDPVVAGGCEFAVIDDGGRVVFHSDSQRNNIENFFVETDENRALRAAVAGRQSEMLNLRYWGDDVRAFATPIKNTPWTLVTFRSKRLLRTLNVETIIITILFLLLYALGFTLLSGAVLLVLPSYRAPWVWPNIARGYDYRRLIYAFAAFAASFAASIYLYRPQPLIVISFTLPGIAVLLAYLRLTRVRGTISIVVALLAVVYAVLWYSHVSTGAAETDVVLPVSWVRLFVLLSGTLGYVAAIFPPLHITTTKETNPLRHLLSPNYSYGTAAVTLLIVAAVLPTAALYKAAYKIEIESFVKQGQMSLVERLEKRIDDLELVRAKFDERVLLEKRKQSGLGVYYQFFFDTRVYQWPTAEEVEKELASQRRQYLADDSVLRTLLRKLGWPVQPPPPADKGRPDTWWNIITRGYSPADQPRNPVPRFVEAFLPQYSEHSVNMRELLHSWSSDDRWTWRRRLDHLDFEANTIRGNHLVVTSEVPRLLPRMSLLDRTDSPLPLRRLIQVDPAPFDDSEWQSDPLGRTVRYGLVVFGLFACAALLVWSIYFITRKVFLMDLREPLWLNPQIPLGPALGGNLLVFARNRERALSRIARDRFIEFRIQSIDVDDKETRWREEMTRVDHEPPGVGLLIPDFDYRPASAELMALKLRLLESSAGQHNRNVVAVTALSPWVLFDDFSAGPDAERWKAILSSFTIRIDVEPPSIAPPFERRRYSHEDALIPALKHMWREIKNKTARVLSRHQIKTFWIALKSPRAMLLTMRTTVVVVHRPLVKAVQSLALSETLNGSAQHARALILRETRTGGDFMRQLGDELIAQVKVLRGEEELYDEIGERASAYYATLWASCSQEEKIVLLHIAADGFANPRDRQVIRRLLARGLVHRAPNFRLMNETFRRFVTGPVRRREVAQLNTNIPESAWDKVRTPLMVGLLGVAVFFFVTQRELFDASLAVVTGLAGGIPAVLRLVGFLIEPRGAAVATLAPR